MIVLGLSDERSDHLVDVSVVDLLQDREGFTWKGHDRLEPRLKPAPFGPGFQPLVLVQCLPPASVTAVALHAEWNLISFGTSHGFGLFDYHRRNAVLARCTLHPNDSLAMEGPLSRVKSLKKSLRQSFRRIRKSRVSGKKRAISTPTSKVRARPSQPVSVSPRPHPLLSHHRAPPLSSRSRRPTPPWQSRRTWPRCSGASSRARPTTRCPEWCAVCASPTPS